MELTFHNITLHLKEGKINGLTGSSQDELMELLLLNQKGPVKINNKLLDKKELMLYRKQITIVKNDFTLDNYYKNVEEWFYSIIQNNNIYPKNIEKKIEDAIKIVGLDSSILKRGFMEISTSEKRLLQLSKTLLINSSFIILEDPFKNLDLPTKKRIIILLQKLVEKYQKMIIILTRNAEDLFQYTNHLIIYKNKKVIAEGDPLILYQQVEELQKHKIMIPEIMEFTYQVRKKGIKIDYYKDIRDIIKDIYKHVKR